MSSDQDCGVHGGTKKSPSAETGLHLLFRVEQRKRRYYAALQDLVTIEISDKGYHHIEYDTRATGSDLQTLAPFATSRLVCVGASRAQGKGRIIHDFTGARAQPRA